MIFPIGKNRTTVLVQRFTRCSKSQSLLTIKDERLFSVLRIELEKANVPYIYAGFRIQMILAVTYYATTNLLHNKRFLYYLRVRCSDIWLYRPRDIPTAVYSNVQPKIVSYRWIWICALIRAIDTYGTTGPKHIYQTLLHQLQRRVPFASLGSFELPCLALQCHTALTLDVLSITVQRFGFPKAHGPNSIIVRNS